MKSLFSAFFLVLFGTTLSGCLASTSSSVGVVCDYSQGKPLWELPLPCQGGR
jgi:hypothetical protein